MRGRRGQLSSPQHLDRRVKLLIKASTWTRKISKGQSLQCWKKELKKKKRNIIKRKDMMGIICFLLVCSKGFLSVSAEEMMKKNKQRVKSNATFKSIQREEKLRVENPSGNKYGEVSGEAGEVDFA